MRLTLRPNVLALMILMGFSTAGAIRGNSLESTSLLATEPFCNDGWAALGAGLTPTGAVYAGAVSGEVVYVAGDFTEAGGAPANYVAKWNGTSWSGLGSGFVYTVYAAALSGDDFYAAGYFETADGSVANRVVKWDGVSWSVLGEFANGEENYLVAMAVAGSDIYVAETFYVSWPFYSQGYILHKWDGTSWSELPALDGAVNAITISGNDVYVGGYFTEAGGVPVNNIAKWDGNNWSALGPGVNGGVSAIAISGSDAYIGGSFTTAGSVPANYVAKWNGSSWSALDSGLNHFVYAIAVSGNDVYVGGEFTLAGTIQANRIAKWNNTGWSALDAGLNSWVTTVLASGNDVYAGGAFRTAGCQWAFKVAHYSVEQPILTVLSTTSPINEGQSTTLTGTIAAPGGSGPFTLDVIWGDGTVQDLSYPAGTASFTLSHQYIDESPASTGSGTYTITATHLGTAGWDSASTTITVNNTPPVLNNIAISPSPAFAGHTAVLTGSITDGPQDFHTVQINWGDGSPDTTLSLWYDQRSISANHQYALSGNFNITVTATDNDGGATGVGIGVTVNPFPTIPNAPSNLTATAVSSTQINLQWTDNSSNEDAFVILRCQGPGTCNGFTQIATVATNIQSYSDAGLPPGEFFSYRVYAFNIAGTSGYSNIARAKTPRR
jgi:fibronectin type III domain protein/PKD domain-containing protein